MYSEFLILIDYLYEILEDFIDNQLIRNSEIHLFFISSLFYWHFIEVLWLFIFLGIYLYLFLLLSLPISRLLLAI